MSTAPHDAQSRFARAVNPTANSTGPTASAVPSHSAASSQTAFDSDGSLPTDSRRLIGQRGEAIAARYLSDLGWRILDRNWRPGPGLRGEVDIVALQPQSAGPGVLVIVEVKTRTSEVAGPPAAAVGPLKLLRLRSLAGPCAAAHLVPHTGLRLDVVSVQLRTGLPAVLRHHRGVGD